MNKNIEDINGDPLPPDNTESLFSFERGKSWIRFLLSKTLLIFVLSLLGMAAGIIYAKRQPIQYESYLTFSLDEDGNNVGGGFAGFAAQFGFGISDNNLFSGDNIVEVIKSRTILERVLLGTDTLNGRVTTMIDYYNGIHAKNKSPQKTKVAFPAGLDNAKFSYAQDSVLYNTQLDILKNHLKAARPDKQLNMYAISFKSPDERFTKIFTDKILSETIKFYTELKTQKSEATLKVLEQRVDVIKGNLNQSISSRAVTQDANLNTAFSAAQVPLQKQQLNMQVYGAAYGELYKNLELARFQYLQDIPLLQVINNNDYPMTRIKVSSVKWGIMIGFLSGLFSIFLLTTFFLIRKSK